MVPVLSKINAVHIFRTYFPKIPVVYALPTTLLLRKDHINHVCRKFWLVPDFEVTSAADLKR
jgi:hypothetical protein